MERLGIKCCNYNGCICIIWPMCPDVSNGPFDSSRATVPHSTRLVTKRTFLVAHWRQLRTLTRLTVGQSGAPLRHIKSIIHCNYDTTQDRENHQDINVKAEKSRRTFFAIHISYSSVLILKQSLSTLSEECPVTVRIGFADKDSLFSNLNWEIHRADKISWQISSGLIRRLPCYVRGKCDRKIKYVAQNTFHNLVKTLSRIDRDFPSSAAWLTVFESESALS